MLHQPSEADNAEAIHKTASCDADSVTDVGGRVRSRRCRTVRDALAAHEKGDDATALQLPRPLAERGMPMRSTISAVDLLTPDRAFPGGAEAAKWFRLAADQGDATSQHNLGALYFSGTGVPQNRGEAAKWYRLAAKQGYVDSQFNLGVMYDLGHGVAQDYDEAIQWFRLAADRATPRRSTMWALCSATVRACRRVMPRPSSGTASLPTRGPPTLNTASASGITTARACRKDYSEAMKWFRLAADQGHAGAQSPLGACCAGPGRVRRTTWRRQSGFASPRIKETSRAVQSRRHVRARRWRATKLRRSVKVVSSRRRPGRRHGAAQSRRHVRDGKGIARPCRRHRMVSPRRRSGLPGAIQSRPHVRNGAGVPQDYARLEVVSPRRQPRPRRRAVQSRRHVRRGRGVPQDCGEAMKWYRLAADQGHAEAQRQSRRDVLTTAASGVPRDYAEAATNGFASPLTKAALVAQNNLGVMYAHGPTACRRILSARTCGSTCRRCKTTKKR